MGRKEIDPPEQPLADRKEYKSIELKNGMEVLLISAGDDDADYCGAAVAVGVGSYDEPLEADFTIVEFVFYDFWAKLRFCQELF